MPIIVVVGQKATIASIIQHLFLADFQGVRISGLVLVQRVEPLPEIFALVDVMCCCVDELNVLVGLSLLSRVGGKQGWCAP